MKLITRINLTLKLFVVVVLKVNLPIWKPFTNFKQRPLFAKIITTVFLMSV